MVDNCQMTTVGYGDYVPQTGLGRLLAFCDDAGSRFPPESSYSEFVIAIGIKVARLALPVGVQATERMPCTAISAARFCPIKAL